MNWPGAILVGVAVLALLRLGFWLVIELTGDTRPVSFGWRVWLSFFLAMAIMLPLGIQLQRFSEYSDGVPFFDGAILLYLEIAGYCLTYCLAGTVIYYLDRKSTPFAVCCVSCYLAWMSADAFVLINK